MAGVWPSYAQIEASPHEVRAVNDVLRSEHDDGAIRQARLYTRARLQREIVALVAHARIADFRAWLATCAHQEFAWVDPLDGVSRLARVVGGVGGVAIRQTGTAGAPPVWEATLTLEGDG